MGTCGSVLVAHLACEMVKLCTIAPLLSPTTVTEVLLVEKAVLLATPPCGTLCVYTATVGQWLAAYFNTEELNVLGSELVSATAKQDGAE